MADERTQVSLAEALGSVRDHLRTLKEARAEFSAATRLVERLRCEARIRDFALTVDEPPSLGGGDQGPNPVELLLAALGTCQEIVYAAFAALLGIPIDRLAITVEGVLDPRGLFDVAEVPVGLTEIHYRIEVASPAPKDEIAKLRRLVDAHCPVLATLSHPARITSSLVVNGEAAE